MIKFFYLLLFSLVITEQCIFQDFNDTAYLVINSNLTCGTKLSCTHNWNVSNMSFCPVSFSFECYSVLSCTNYCSVTFFDKMSIQVSCSCDTYYPNNMIMIHETLAIKQSPCNNVAPDGSETRFWIARVIVFSMIIIIFLLLGLFYCLRRRYESVVDI